ncbi:MAG: thioredoxin domain-containing protein, partial [Salinivirgaceae bacterium]
GLTAGLSIGLVAGSMAFQSTGTTQADVNNTDNSPDNPDNSDSQDSDEEETTTVSMENIDLEDEPSMGEEDAPVKIVEYSDFGCPFCAEWKGVDASAQIPIDRMQIADTLEREYIDTGEVELIAKDFPVENLHANAPDAHLMADCVYRESSNEDYWDFHDRLYEDRDQWMESAENNPEETFRQISNDLGLDTEAMMQCLEEGDNSEVNEDRENALRNFGNLGTPTFFVGTEGEEFVEISGAQPIERFEEEINAVQNS